MRFSGYLNIPIDGRYAFDLYVGKNGFYLEAPQPGWKISLSSVVEKFDSGMYGRYPENIYNSHKWINHKRELVKIFSDKNPFKHVFKHKELTDIRFITSYLGVKDDLHMTVYSESLRKDIFIHLVAHLYPDCEHSFFNPGQEISLDESSKTIQSFRATESMCCRCGCLENVD